MRYNFISTKVAKKKKRAQVLRTWRNWNLIRHWCNDHAPTLANNLEFSQRDKHSHHMILPLEIYLREIDKQMLYIYTIV